MRFAVPVRLALVGGKTALQDFLGHAVKLSAALFRDLRQATVHALADHRRTDRVVISDNQMWHAVARGRRRLRSFTILIFGEVAFQNLVNGVKNRPAALVGRYQNPVVNLVQHFDRLKTAGGWDSL